VSSDDEPTPFSKNGWEGYISPYRGTPIGLFCIRARKGARIITTKPMTPQDVEKFDPDEWWSRK
jgi:hypothetical protein